MADTSPGDVFAQAGFTRLDTPILQPADVFLDRSGDAIRRRLFMLTDPGGRERCLRPELTIPLALKVIAEGGAPARVWSEGRIFRYGGGVQADEQIQTGIEHFGGTNEAADDAEVFALIRTACEAGGAGALTIRMGDLGIFRAVLEAVDLPRAWRDRLRRHLWHTNVFADLLARLKGEAAQVEDENAGLLASIAGLSEEEAVRAVHDILKLANIRPIGGRSVEEITARFLEKAQDARADVIAPKAAEAIEAFLALEVPAAESADAVAALATTHRLDLADAIEALRARNEALVAAGVGLKTARFAPSFGREIEYYTGFVFEIHEGKKKVAGGGRYDGLLEGLGTAATSAVGGAVWPNRLGGAS